MRFNSQVLGFTLVAMASLVKADFYANFFDGECLLPRSFPHSQQPAYHTPHLFMDSLNRIDYVSPCPTSYSLQSLTSNQTTAAASTAEWASTSATLAASARPAAALSTCPTTVSWTTSTASS
jgi:hypothetical protein